MRQSNIASRILGLGGINCRIRPMRLRAIAYRAVMRSTVNRTLADALSENVVTLTAQMREVVQQDADDLGLGVEILGFTIGGMHPPVMVADALRSSGLRGDRKGDRRCQCPGVTAIRRCLPPKLLLW